MSNKKLLYIIGTYPGLTTTFIDREIRMLRKWGLTLQVLAIRHPVGTSIFSKEQQRLQEGVVYILPVMRGKLLLSHLYFALFRPRSYFGTLLYLLTRPHPDFEARFKTLLHFGEGVYAAYLLRDRPLDHLHGHFLDRAAVVTLILSRLLKIPYSLTAHANDIYVNPVLLREKVMDAEFVTTCTGYNYTHLLKMMEKQLGDKLHLVYHGIDVNNYIPPSVKPQRERPLLLSIGRLVEKKGFPHLLKACRCLKDLGYDFECQIVGEGPLHQELQELIVQLGLEDSVTLCGAIPHEMVIEKYKQAILFVLPCVMAEDGDRDGIPNVLIESMAMKLPVVSTYLSGIPELVDDNVNGLLVSPGDEEALTQALANLIDNAAWRTELGEAGRQTVLQGFDVERNVRRMFELFVRAQEGVER
jgi:glycosyltransferase involved in cell wall biosynthesis